MVFPQPKRLDLWYHGTVPTVLRLGGLRVVIYPNDHRPVHIHVVGSDAEAVFNLDGPSGPVTVRENFGFSRPEVTRIERALLSHVEQLYRAWEEIHGKR
jgi:uncharacterized protein DUF4160